MIAGVLRRKGVLNKLRRKIVNECRENIRR